MLYTYYCMIQLVILLGGWVAASISTAILLAVRNYEAGLAALIITLVIKMSYKRAASLFMRKKFTEVIFSVTDVAVTFIVVSSIGYAGIVHWGVIAPLLLIVYLAEYMGLRIGIATGEPAPQAATLEDRLLPLCLIMILLAAIFYPNTTAAGLSLANWAGILLLAGSFVLAVQRVRLAYAMLRMVKP